MPVAALNGQLGLSFTLQPANRDYAGVDPQFSQLKQMPLQSTGKSRGWTHGKRLRLVPIAGGPDFRRRIGRASMAAS